MVIKNQVILTCFSGRESCMSVLLTYAERLLDKGLIQRMDCWDFTKQDSDSVWLHKHLFAERNNPNLLVTNRYAYKTVPNRRLVKGGAPLTFYVTGRNDAHLKIMHPGSDQEIAEISLGAYNGTKSLIRKQCQGQPHTIRDQRLFDNGNKWERVRLTWGLDNTINVMLDTSQNAASSISPFLSLPLTDTTHTTDTVNVAVAGWDGKPVRWLFQDNAPSKPPTAFFDPRIRLMHVTNKREWLEYYKYYKAEDYESSIIIKCDDDIVYIEIDQFAEFIRHRRENPDLLFLFPNIWNNEIISYFQQQKGLLPREVAGEITYQPKGFGTLWHDGKATQKVHEYFIANHAELLTKSKAMTSIIKVNLNDRISVNFFAIRSEDLGVFQLTGTDDEHDLTQQIPGFLNRHIGIDMTMSVCHLSFYQQLKTGLDVQGVLNLYKDLAKSPSAPPPAVSSAPPAVSSAPPAVPSAPPAVPSAPPAVSSAPPAVSSAPPAVTSYSGHLLIFIPHIAWSKGKPVYGYDNMLNECGYSGTDMAAVEIAYNMAAKHNYRVTCALEGYEGEDRVDVGGVRFISPRAITDDMCKSITAFTPLQFVEAPEASRILKRLDKTVKIIWWMHCLQYPTQQMVVNQWKQAGYKMTIITPSQWVRDLIVKVWSDPTTIVPNAINSQVFPSTAPMPDLTSKRGNFIFHASFERGGQQAVHIVQRYKQTYGIGKMHVASYVPEDVRVKTMANQTLDSSSQSQLLEWHGSMGKRPLKQLLDKCDYFIYPLVLEDARVHHDTYGCVVHEAMVCGVIVITWDAACLKSLYGDAIVTVPTLPYSNYDSTAPFGSNPHLLTDAARDALWSALEDLESNPQKKEALRVKAREWALSPNRTWEASAQIFKGVLDHVPTHKIAPETKPQKHVKTSGKKIL